MAQNPSDSSSGLDRLFREIQWQPEQLTEMQARELRSMVLHAAAHSPFYEDRLRSVVRDGVFDPAGWADIPIFDRAEAQAKRESLFADEVPPESAGFVEDETSGSTGLPFSHRASRRVSIVSDALTQRTYDDHGIDPAQVLAEIRVPRQRADWPDGARGSGWNRATPQSLSICLDVACSIEQQLDWLRRSSPAYLLTYPSNAFALAEHVLATNDPSFALSNVFTVGGNLTDDMRKRIREAFGCSVVDMYGCQEAGLLASQCPENPGHHVCSESVLLEVVREDGTLAPAGETGRVVLTSLHNYAMPLIRYSIGDYAIRHDGPCPCGRALPLLTRIVGRSGNLFVFPDGGRRLLNLAFDEIRQSLGFESLQVVQHKVDEIEMRYVPLQGAALPRREGLEAYFRRVLHPGTRLTLTPLSALERDKSGKFEILKCLISRDEA